MNFRAETLDSKTIHIKRFLDLMGNSGITKEVPDSTDSYKTFEGMRGKRREFGDIEFRDRKDFGFGLEPKPGVFGNELKRKFDPAGSPGF